mmetsp:Transcript_28128/g.51936  ORF Transcript_28128/g.51936 Transcript_28128/m.51936 type:complete len:84 (-) Transcript_28128:261-512(-)|eukprot:CAMPEP_0201897666 /NCGR_PEP_ID=MMETSP0902-20130614/47024_1 /ASSEMBLY_ACC=CAM_ASM_000551 /TAXON_ID=420261 /ORGANISM="Thalassiosira antarctica, Strain CCMP982" /LENGTH=83 /DNA_ID=CAMNT_0048430591 /DNA_START=166 /DNA_END=417 /DNA_ORIENTATION=-
MIKLVVGITVLGSDGVLGIGILVMLDSAACFGITLAGINSTRRGQNYKMSQKDAYKKLIKHRRNMMKNDRTSPKACPDSSIET